MELNTWKSSKNLSILYFSLLFSWVLAIPFEGDTLYALMEDYGRNPGPIIFWGIGIHFCGLFLSGFLIHSLKAAKRLHILCHLLCLLTTGLLFLPLSSVGIFFLMSCSFVMGVGIGAWGFQYQAFTPSAERMDTAAKILVLSNILMVINGFIALSCTPKTSLLFLLLLVLISFYLCLQIPVQPEECQTSCQGAKTKSAGSEGFIRILGFFYLFIFMISINSGIMYRIVRPEFDMFFPQAGWYWAIPYILAILLIMKWNWLLKEYLLYFSIALSGISFVLFMVLQPTLLSFILINTLMMGTFGIFDLFWWKIMGEMFDFNENPAMILGTGLSANVFGIMVGGILGEYLMRENIVTHRMTPPVFALFLIFMIMALLPILNNKLNALLKEHAFYIYLPNLSQEIYEKHIQNVEQEVALTEREKEIVQLIIQGITYKDIAQRLFISDNTVKSHIKNIYRKLEVKNKIELIHKMK